jgi:hypothetical protein
MPARDMALFMWGATTLGCWVIALFFLKYWLRTRDQLFLFFSVAFLILSLNWIGLAIINPDHESRHWIFVVRVVAFLFIILGIVDKNRPAGPRP